MAAPQPAWPVAVLGAVLGGGRRGLYAPLQRQAAPARSLAELERLARRKASADKPPRSDGRRRLVKPLQAAGDTVGRCTGRRVLQQAGGAVAGRRRRPPPTTESRHGYGVAPHVLARHCAVTVPQVAWGGAGTSGWPEAGGWDTSVLVDVYARQVVGWAMSDSMETPLVTAALEMALGRRQPTAGRMHQSDRGAQYARQADRGRLAAQGIAWSLRGKGECWDKAVADRFLGSLKRERTAKRY